MSVERFSAQRVPPELALVPAWFWTQFICAGCGRDFTGDRYDACPTCEAEYAQWQSCLGTGSRR